MAVNLAVNQGSERTTPWSRSRKCPVTMVFVVRPPEEATKLTTGGTSRLGTRDLVTPRGAGVACRSLLGICRPRSLMFGDERCSERPACC